MNAIVKPDEEAARAIEKVVMEGDLSSLSASERLAYYRSFCEAAGLDPRLSPLGYVKLSGQLRLYAGKAASDQLRAVHKISITVKEVRETDDEYEVIVEASTPDGRVDSDIGSVPISGLRGERRSNAKMKAMTKAKRRVTLSMTGLGVLDETEVVTIPDAKTFVLGSEVEIADPKSTPKLEPNAPKMRTDEHGEVVPHPGGHCPVFSGGAFAGKPVNSPDIPADYLLRSAHGDLEEMRKVFDEAAEDIQAWSQWLIAKVVD